MPIQTKTPPTITAAAAAAVLVTDRRRHLPPSHTRPSPNDTSALARVSYEGMYPGRGQMSSTVPVTVGPIATTAT